MNLDVTLNGQDYAVSITVNHIKEVKGTFSPYEVSDLDFYGYRELEFVSFPTIKTLSILSGLTENQVYSTIEDTVWNYYEHTYYEGSEQ